MDTTNGIGRNRHGWEGEMAAGLRDPFSQLEYTGWQRVAGKYDSAWGGLTRLFIRPLLDAVGLEPSLPLLDVACGPGYVAEAALALGAAPLGLDFSPAMVQLARARVRGVVFVCGDAQALPFEPGTFDAVLMNFGLLHLAHPEAALAEARRVLRVGGRYAFTVWAGPEQSAGASVVDQAIRAHASFDVELPQGPAYYGYGDAESCRRVLDGVGFDLGSLRFYTVTATWQVPTASFVFAAERDAGVRTAALLAAQPPAVCAAIEAQLATGLMSFRNAAGFAIPYAAHVISVTAA